MPPSLANGEICYVGIPALDVRRSSVFYQRVFGWSLRERDDGRVAFDDGVNEVSGTWVHGRAPATEPGLPFYIMVDNITSTLDAVVANGGAIVQPIGADMPAITARIRDPAGKVIGLYQERALAPAK